jgi:hypothetical protein
MTTKHRLLIAALLATLAAAWFAPGASTQDVLLAPRATKANSAATTTVASVKEAALPLSNTAAVLSIIPREHTEGDPPDAQLFTATQWLPVAASAPPQPAPVAPIAAPPPPPPPQAPPLPFKFLGRYQDADQAVVFLQYNDQNFLARVGDTLQGQYKVESLSATSLNLIYLPLNLPQSLSLGGP